MILDDEQIFDLVLFDEVELMCQRSRFQYHITSSKADLTWHFARFEAIFWNSLRSEIHKWPSRNVAGEMVATYFNVGYTYSTCNTRPKYRVQKESWRSLTTLQYCDWEKIVSTKYTGHVGNQVQHPRRPPKLGKDGRRFFLRKQNIYISIIIICLQRIVWIVFSSLSR